MDSELYALYTGLIALYAAYRIIRIVVRMRNRDKGTNDFPNDRD